MDCLCVKGIRVMLAFGTRVWYQNLNIKKEIGLLKGLCVVPFLLKN